jgi:hypothetical protein
MALVSQVVVPPYATAGPSPSSGRRSVLGCDAEPPDLDPFHVHVQLTLGRGDGGEGQLLDRHVGRPFRGTGPGPGADDLDELVPGQDRLAVRGDDPVARLEPGARGGATGVDLSDDRFGKRLERLKKRTPCEVVGRQGEGDGGASRKLSVVGPAGADRRASTMSFQVSTGSVADGDDLGTEGDRLELHGALLELSGDHDLCRGVERLAVEEGHTSQDDDREEKVHDHAGRDDDGACPEGLGVEISAATGCARPPHRPRGRRCLPCPPCVRSRRAAGRR